MRHAEILHDDLLELHFKVGWVPLDPEELNRFFGVVYSLILRRMKQAAEDQEQEFDARMSQSRYLTVCRCYQDQLN